MNNQYLLAIKEIEKKKNVIFPSIAIKSLSSTDFEKNFIDHCCPEHIECHSINNKRWHYEGLDYPEDYKDEKVFYIKELTIPIRVSMNEFKIPDYEYLLKKNMIKTKNLGDDLCPINVYVINKELQKELDERLEKYKYVTRKVFKEDSNGEYWSWPFMVENQGCCAWVLIYKDKDEDPDVYCELDESYGTRHKKISKWSEYLKKRWRK
jgi:hypothetical protein